MSRYILPIYDGSTPSLYLYIPNNKSNIKSPSLPSGIQIVPTGSELITFSPSGQRDYSIINSDQHQLWSILICEDERHVVDDIIRIVKKHFDYELILTTTLDKPWLRNTIEKKLTCKCGKLTPLQQSKIPLNNYPLLVKAPKSMNPFSITMDSNKPAFVFPIDVQFAAAILGSLIATHIVMAPTHLSHFGLHLTIPSFENDHPIIKLFSESKVAVNIRTNLQPSILFSTNHPSKIPIQLDEHASNEFVGLSFTEASIGRIISKVQTVIDGNYDSDEEYINHERRHIHDVNELPDPSLNIHVKTDISMSTTNPLFELNNSQISQTSPPAKLEIDRGIHDVPSSSQLVKSSINQQLKSQHPEIHVPKNQSHPPHLDDVVKFIKLVDRDYARYSSIQPVKQCAQLLLLRVSQEMSSASSSFLDNFDLYVSLYESLIRFA